MDRKSVMAWLEGLAQDDWRMFHSDSEVQWIARNALAMLNEDCHNCKLECLLQKYDQLKEKYDKLLKEQEAIVRCKDCTYLNVDTGICVVGISHGHKDTFYCAYGKRR